MNITMKSIILMKLFVLCVQNILCNESLLSKFHQNVYKIREVRMEKISHDENYFNFLEVKTFKYNRTTPVINITLQLKVTVKDKVEVLVQAFKFLSNEYRHYPIRFQVNLKQAVDANAIGLAAMRNCGNFGNFSFAKDVTYTVCRFVFDESRCPPLIPSGRYRIDLKFIYFDDEIAYFYLFAEIYIPIPKMKKITKS